MPLVCSPKKNYSNFKTEQTKNLSHHRSAEGGKSTTSIAVWKHNFDKINWFPNWCLILIETVREGLPRSECPASECSNKSKHRACFCKSSSFYNFTITIYRTRQREGSLFIGVQISKSRSKQELVAWEITQILDDDHSATSRSNGERERERSCRVEIQACRNSLKFKAWNRTLAASCIKQSVSSTAIKRLWNIHSLIRR